MAETSAPDDTHEADRLKTEVPDGGVLYALANISIPDQLKIGRTSRSARHRALELQTPGVPTPFTVAWESRPLANGAKAEAAAHRRLLGHRVSKNRGRNRKNGGGKMRNVGVEAGWRSKPAW